MNLTDSALSTYADLSPAIQNIWEALLIYLGKQFSPGRGEAAYKVEFRQWRRNITDGKSKRLCTYVQDINRLEKKWFTKKWGKNMLRKNMCYSNLI